MKISAIRSDKVYSKIMNAPLDEYSVAAKPSVRKNGNHLSG